MPVESVLPPIETADTFMPTTNTETAKSDVAPFPAYACADRYVALGSIAETLLRVGRSVIAREAISLVIGPPGVGKTLLLALLVKQFAKSHDVVNLGDTTIDDRSAFLRHLLHHLGVDYKKTAENDLHLALVDRVCGSDAAAEGLLILIDEAQSLAPEVLECIRLVTNIMRNGKPRVSAVVAGGMKLDEILVDNVLEPFVQRVATRCYLHPMNLNETRQFIRETIRGCGADPDVTILDSAIAAIHHAASGVPRLVNQMMTQAIDTAADTDVALIDDAIVDRAWATLQQLPSPMVEQPALKSSAASNIEFGELDSGSAWSLPEKSSKPAKASVVVSGQLPPVAPEPVAMNPGMIESDCDGCDFDEPACDLGDIEVESSTAMWVDEATEPMPMTNSHTSPMSGRLQTQSPRTVEPVALPSVLFGDFDVEEDLSLRGDVEGSIAYEGNDDDDDHDDAADAVIPFRSSAAGRPTENLEAILHQEIIGLSSYDASVMVYSEATDCGAMNFESEAGCDFDAYDEADADNGADADNDAEAVDDDFDIRLSHDDSDLLIIDDELELTRTDAASPHPTAAPQGMTIDFQSMLTRMRAGK